MIEGLDSSFDRPTPAIIAQARAAGVRLWSGYLATIETPGAFNLASPWDRASFDVARTCGGPPLAMASGWDDPVALEQLAALWGVRLCLDLEDGIRGDGPWVQPWLDASGAGLYGLLAVHGHRAAFHVAAFYPCVPPVCCQDVVATWPVASAPATPLGWQQCGTHQRFGLSVDAGRYDDWFLTPLENPRSSEMILVTDPAGAGHILFSDGTILAGIDSAATAAQFTAAGLGSTGTLDQDTWAKLVANDASVRAARTAQAKLAGTFEITGSGTIA